MNDKQKIVISMPLEYWKQEKDFWKIPIDWILEAQKKETKTIGRLKDGTILKIGNLSNQK